MEVDVECFLCDGGEAAASASIRAGWRSRAAAWCIRTVLRNGGYDPSEWSGFAFGMGPERITMLKHGIQDIRYFWSERPALSCGSSKVRAKARRHGIGKGRARQSPNLKRMLKPLALGSADVLFVVALT